MSGLFGTMIDFATKPERIVDVRRQVPQSGDLRAPWWEHIALLRVGNGEPLAAAFAGEYLAVSKKLDQLAQDEDEGLPASAIEGAKHFLSHALFAGLAAPRVSWHGRSAVVLYWVAGKRITFFTFDEDGKLSVLQEHDRAFVYREDDIDRIAWGRFFP